MVNKENIVAELLSLKDALLNHSSGALWAVLHVDLGRIPLHTSHQIRGDKQTESQSWFSDLHQNVFFQLWIKKNPGNSNWTFLLYWPFFHRSSLMTSFSEGTACQRDFWQGTRLTKLGTSTAKQQCVPPCHTECCYWVSDAGLYTVLHFRSFWAFGSPVL